jgi:hypothetical protein
VTKARAAGVFYLLTFLTGGFAVLVRNQWSVTAGLIAGACYVVVTLLCYVLFKPVNARLSMLAAVDSEGALTLWLLAIGVNAERWAAQAHTA